MSRDKQHDLTASKQVDAFLAKVSQNTSPTRSRNSTPADRAMSRGRLIFAMDATASRAPTWDSACQLQGDMFTRSEGLGGLDVQLVYYRGHHECRASRWHTQADGLLHAMSAVRCLSGATQIGRVLQHAITEARQQTVAALVFVGDCCEEPLDPLMGSAGELRLLGVPVFLFQEGDDPIASAAFARIAALSGGAHCQFDLHSSGELGELLNAAAVYASGGSAALGDYARLQRDPRVRALLEQLN